MDKKSFCKGLFDSYPICVAVSMMYLAFGILANINGLTLYNSTLMTATIFAVPLQLLLIENQDFNLLTIITNTIFLNLKFALMAASLVSFWSQLKLSNLLSLHFVANSNYMVAINSYKDYDKNQIFNKWIYYLGVSLPTYIVAIIATIIGYYLWDLKPDLQDFLKPITYIILPVHFTCLTIKRKSERLILIATIIGFVLTPLIAQIDKKLTLPIWIIIAGILTLFRDRKCL